MDIEGVEREMQGLGHLDHLLATWEWRMGPTPWLVMEPLT